MPGRRGEPRLAAAAYSCRVTPPSIAPQIEEVQHRNQYFDLAPLRRLYRRLPGVTDPGLVAKKLAL